MNVLKFLFGTKNDRELKKLWPLVREINRIEEKLQSENLTDEDFPKRTAELKARVAETIAKTMPKNPSKDQEKAVVQAALDAVLPEAFALLKNACRHLVGTTEEVCGHTLTWNMIPFDVQLIGGIVLHQGKISEMQTGEGKTLVATMPLYLNALAGRNVQLVTVNDYLALRDATWMGHLYKYLGLTVGCIQNSMGSEERRAQYDCDITYGTNSEFGFDYLRDNGMAQQPEQVVQNGHNFAIVDEVDSFLIDEARTPLIISGPATISTSHVYTELNPLVSSIVRVQMAMCNDLVRDAKKAIDEGNVETFKEKIYQVYHSMPRHKQFRHMLENAELRKHHEDVEMQMLSEMRKERARQLKGELYFTIDERTREVALTDKGCEKICPSDPTLFVLPDLAAQMSAIDGDKSLTDAERIEKRRDAQSAFVEKSDRVHVVDQLLRAYCLYEKDVEYVVQDNHVYIVDEFTGRVLPGRRWSDGLHQAVEAKEGVEIEKESQTLATITIQNYFRLYGKLSGMTGTAETEAREFKDIYKLDVVSIPTNKPVNRTDGNDQIYRTEREKFKAIIADVEKRHAKGQPILLGTVEVATSEVLSRMLKIAHIPHEVLNAKNHAREAEIVSPAGQPGAVTIATNMAGRGTDIKLGPGVTELGGLHVIGSERHESRRIDRQLRGRCSRQGDPGSSQFFISLEDKLMRLFGSQRIAGIMQRLGLKEGEVMEHKWLNRSVETAQRRVEQQHFAVRKRTLEYDDVMNKQRSIVYELRGRVLNGDQEGVHNLILDVMNDLVMTQAERYLFDAKDGQLIDFMNWLGVTFPVTVTEDELRPLMGTPELAGELVMKKVVEAYETKCAGEDQATLPYMERGVFLQVIDREWQDFLRAMDDLRTGVNLRAYGQRDPLIEYKKEAFEMFETLMATIKAKVVSSEFRCATAARLQAHFNMMRAQTNAGAFDSAEAEPNGAKIEGAGAEGKGASSSAMTIGDVFASMMNQNRMAAGVRPVAASNLRLQPSSSSRPPQAAAAVGRNDPCPCGSGKKYKKCCGKGLV
ncbi:MAG: preprotein translocase subunit SecA [Kiritimatiellae bacterium]|nr:preprotein translocase subunit SecA [Kiritimatiellia bacterium]